MGITIPFEVEYCSLCPFSRIEGPYWNPDFDEEDYSVICCKLDEVVHEDLHWTECAGRNSLEEGIDEVPNKCPFKKVN